MTDSPRVERLKAELALAVLEEKLTAAKPVNEDGTPKLDKTTGRPLRAPEALRLKTRAARRNFRNKYRKQVNVHPAVVGAGAKVGEAKAGTK